MRTYTIAGQRMLDRVGGAMREVGAIVRASHERWDGSGYADGSRARRSRSRRASSAPATPTTR
jgi:response regulator RpfG family c-di-GMP phosphodiesterase